MTRSDLISARMRETFDPAHLEVVNESHMHSVPKGSETHFRVVIASAAFAKLSRIERHRAVQRALGEEFRSGLHALTIAAYSAEEWATSPAVAASPPCLGGSKAGG